MKKKEQAKQRMELLSPAGSMESFLGVINAGADAVYAAGKQFGARAFANNFTEEEILEAIKICHLKNRRFYLTLNTLLKNLELKNDLYHYFAPLYEAGIDGVIVQDFGVVNFLQKEFPQVELHGSTQMAVMDARGANLLKEAGFTQLVLPRELSLKEIAGIRSQTDIKLEVFTHGALCYSYSGECLMSSMLGGRSGNRGRCAQPCRLSYEVCNSCNQKHGKAGYPLSLKDHASLELLPELVIAGVDSLKIEGRMKSPEYATGVTALYRKYLDLALENQAVEVSKEDRKALLDLGNRSGFTNSYLSAKGRIHKDMISWDKPAHEKNDENPILKDIWEKNLGGLHKIPCTISAKLKVGNKMELTIVSGEHKACVQGAKVDAAQKRPVSSQEIRQKLEKLGNTCFYAKEIIVDADDAIFISMKDINDLRRQGIALLEDQILSKEKDRKSSLPDVSNENLNENRDCVKKSTLYISCYRMTQFQTVLNSIKADVICVDVHGFSEDELNNALANAAEHKQKLYLSLPLVFRQNIRQEYENKLDFLKKFDGFLLRSFDEIAFVNQFFEEKPLLLDANLYVTNDMSNKYLKQLCKSREVTVTASYELNKGELTHLLQGNVQYVIYGRYPLMTSDQCVYQNTFGKCCREDKTLYLKDRYQKYFPVEMLCDICTNRIYNTLPTSLLKQLPDLDQLAVNSYRLDFIYENEEEIHDVLRAYSEKKPERIHWETTAGHFKRGVE